MGKTSLNYYDEPHIYEIDGIVIPSVSNILASTMFKNKYAGVGFEVLGKAASFGTNVHKAIELGEHSFLNVEERRCYIKYLVQVSEYFAKVMMQESMVTNKGLYAGMFDCLGFIKKDGKYVLTLFDVKTTAAMDAKYLSYQLSMYALGWESSGSLRELFWEKNKKEITKLGVRKKDLDKIQVLACFWLPKASNGGFKEVPFIKEADIKKLVNAFYKLGKTKLKAKYLGKNGEGNKTLNLNIEKDCLIEPFKSYVGTDELVLQMGTFYERAKLKTVRVYK